jgi:hypothetical protein
MKIRVVPTNKLPHDVLFDLGGSCRIQAQPILIGTGGPQWWRNGRCIGGAIQCRHGSGPGHEDDLELASMEVVADHDLVSIPLECGACLRD